MGKTELTRAEDEAAAALAKCLGRPFPAVELFDHIADIVFFIKDREGRYVAVNQTLADRCNFADKRALIGRKASQVFAPPLGERFEAGVAEVIERHGLPWHVTRLGCRVEYLFRPERPRNGSEAAAGGNALLDRLIHLYALNRGILLTPFHNMALMSPATTEADVARHTEVFDAAARELA